MVDTISAFIATNFLVTVGILLVSAIPLYFAVKLLGGNISFIKVILVSILLSIISAAAYNFLGLTSGIIIILTTLFIYKLMFHLTWGKAILAWLLQQVFVFIAIYIFIFLAIA